MTMKIYKYKLPLAPESTLKMGAGRILSVQAQDDRLTLWVATRANVGEVERQFRVIATGEPFEDKGETEYLGTVQLGWTVWHVFEVLF